MRDRHWKMLMQTTGKHFTMDEKFCLGDLLALELHNYVDACRCAAAVTDCCGGCSVQL
jgi:dynein heavy chain